MKSLKGILFALISSITFGLIPFFSIPLLDTGMNAFSILFYRFLFSTILIGIVAVLRRENMRIPFAVFVQFIALGILYALTSFLLIWAYSYISSGVATTIHFMYPLAVAVFMFLFFREKISPLVFLAIILSILGVVFLSRTEGELKWQGIVIAIGTIFTYSFYILGVNKTKAGRCSTEVITFYVLFAAAVMFFILSLTSAQGLEPITNKQSLFNLIGLALICTVVSDFTLVLAIKLVGSVLTSILGCMEPLVAVAVGILYFEEKITMFNLLGLIIILFAVVLVIISSKEKKESQKLEL